MRAIRFVPDGVWVADYLVRANCMLERGATLLEHDDELCCSRFTFLDFVRGFWRRNEVEEVAE